MGSKAFVVQVDVRSEEDVRRLISMIIDKCGRLDILVNNAGVAYKKILEETTLDEYDETMAQTLKVFSSAQSMLFPIPGGETTGR